MHCVVKLSLLRTRKIKRKKSAAIVSAVKDHKNEVAVHYTVLFRHGVVQQCPCNEEKKCVAGLISLSVTLYSHFYVTLCSHMFEEHIVDIFVLILLFAYVLQLRVSPYS